MKAKGEILGLVVFKQEGEQEREDEGLGVSKSEGGMRSCVETYCHVNRSRV